jgi:hypothetical protein
VDRKQRDLQVHLEAVGEADKWLETQTGLDAQARRIGQADGAAWAGAGRLGLGRLMELGTPLGL